MQERLVKLENNVTPKFHDGAAKSMVTPTLDNGAADRMKISKFHDGATGNSTLQEKTSSPENSCKKNSNVKPFTSSNPPPTNLDACKTGAARPTSVLNSPDKKEVPQNKPHSSRMTSIDNVGILPADLSHSGVRKKKVASCCREKKKLYTGKRMKSRRPPTPPESHPCPASGKCMKP